MSLDKATVARIATLARIKVADADLDKMVGEPVEVKLNGKPFARGEVVTVAENFGVRITELLAGG